ncbi:MAG: hypothetical protein AMS24_03875 [Chlamydiae bacterium SM23_39]|nr:MAG: hypothetical protein AMS24_03875 [Chlamydiae bacterium SM23_39]
MTYYITIFLSIFYLTSNFSLQASIIKIIPTKDKKTYAELPGNNKEDREKIEKLIILIGSHGKISLLMHHQKEARKLGKELEHVHPLQFLGCIFSNKKLKPYMEDIDNDFFKWSNFIKGLSTNLEHEYIKNNLIKYLDDFAKEINIPREYIESYIKNRDWKGLVKFLIYTP